MLLLETALLEGNAEVLAELCRIGCEVEAVIGTMWWVGVSEMVKVLVVQLVEVSVAIDST